MTNFLRNLSAHLFSLTRIILSFFAWIVELLAGVGPSTSDDDVLGSSIRGGDLNLRTGKFDDGTDPAGWYGRD